VKISLLILCLISVFVSSCSTSPTIPPPNTVTPTNIKTSTPSATFTVIPTETSSPTQLSTISPSSTPRAANEPGLIALFGEQSSYDSSLVFSPDGILIAQANYSVKLWDVGTHTLIRELKYPYSEKYYATKALFSPDNSLIAVNITDYITYNGSPNGHLLVWDVSTGELLQDWAQEHATMSAYDGFQSEPRIYNIPVNAMAFFPASTKLVYANGNKIEIRDVRQDEESIVWSLGDTMYASELGIRDDGEFLYILMKWYKDLTFPALYRWKFKAQIWHTATKSLRREIKFEEVYPLNADMWLVEQYLVHEDKIKPTFDALDLSADKRKDFPYRTGWKYFNADASLMLVVRYIGVDEDKEGIEIWNTDTWRNIYAFKPTFIDNIFYLSGIAFNPNNSLLAIDYHGQVYLWDIRPTIQP